MSWKLAQAKQQLSTVVREAAHHPQVITNRDRPVAVVVGTAEYEAFRAWKEAHPGGVAAALSECARLCAEEDFALELPPRADRENPLLPETRRVPRRHQRRQ